MITHKEAIELIKEARRNKDEYYIYPTDKDFEGVIKLLEKEMWHKYPDEKPTKEGDYLISLVGGDVGVDNYNIFDDTEYFWSERHNKDYIVAWRELPKYEEEE